LVTHATLSELRPRAWMTLSGCDLFCIGHFALVRRELGKSMTSDQLPDLLKTACLEKVIVTGGNWPPGSWSRTTLRSSPPR